MKKKSIPWIVLGFAVFVIFFLTFQKGEESIRLTSTVQDTIVQYTGRPSPNNWKRWQYNRQFFRKMAHVFEYAILGVSALAAIRTIKKKKIIKNAVVATIICVTISIVDQLIRIPIPQKEFDPFDLLLDFCGYFSTICLVSLIYMVKTGTKKNETKNT